MKRRENTFNKKKLGFEKTGLKLNIGKKKRTKIMASGPIASGQTRGRGGSRDSFPLFRL